MRDGDGDGKCQEEDGKWVPCPPGVGDGNVIDAAGRAIRAIGKPIGDKPDSKPEPAQHTLAKAREKAAAKAAKIAAAAESNVPKEKRVLAQELINNLDEYEMTRGREKKRMLMDDIHDAVVELFSHEIDGLDGKKYVTEVSGVHYEYGELKFSGYFYEVQADGRLKEAGSFNRTITPIVQKVEHDAMYIKEAYQGAGLGSSFNARNEILYREMGMTRITTEGLSNATHSGATHWPKNGFDWDNIRSQTEFIATVQAAVRFHRSNNTNGKSDYFDSNEQANEVEALLKEASAQAMRHTGPDRLTAADLLNWPGAEAWFKRSHSIISYAREL